MKNALVKALVNIVTTKKNTAITKGLCEKLGTDVLAAFTQWEIACDDLYERACEYAEVYNDRTEMVSGQKFRDAETALTRQWWACLGFGEQDLLNPKLFIRPQDAETLRTWASGLVIIQTDKARVFSRTGKVLFRKYVETLLMVRMTSAALVSDADRDTYLEYTGLQKSVRAKKLALNGGKGAETEGLREKLEKARKAKISMEKLLTDAGVPANVLDEIITERETVIAELETAVKDAEASIEKSEARMEEIKANYEAALARINEVEEM